MSRKVAEPTFQVAQKVLEVVNEGLVCGLGDPEPGKMCVEAAVCYAMGEPHGDQPKCVAPAVRSLKIALNDRSEWSSNEDRAEGLRRLAIAQLGSKSLGKQFVAAYTRRVKQYVNDAIEEYNEEYTLSPVEQKLRDALTAIDPLDRTSAQQEALSELDERDDQKVVIQKAFFDYMCVDCVIDLMSDQLSQDAYGVLLDLCGFAEDALAEIGSPGVKWANRLLGRK